jgi:hypothetical protein
MFKSTTHEHDWLFYHDALSLLTAQETVSWMKEQGYYKRWVLPKLGLHSDDPDLKQYRGWPVGNSPENTPWDTSLNKDLHDVVKYHVLATADIEKTHTSRSTSSPTGSPNQPTRLTLSVRRLPHLSYVPPRPTSQPANQPTLVKTPQQPWHLLPLETADEATAKLLQLQ